MKKLLVGIAILGLLVLVIGVAWPGPFKGGQGSGLRIDLKGIDTNAHPDDDNSPVYKFMGGGDTNGPVKLKITMSDITIGNAQFKYPVGGFGGDSDGGIRPTIMFEGNSDGGIVKAKSSISFKDLMDSIPMLMVNGGGAWPGPFLLHGGP